MNEDFLHYLWKHKKIKLSHLKTTNQKGVVLQQVGDHNVDNSGPDFFNSRLIIDNQKWAGNVEIHIKSSDWYAHHHEKDPAYDNVILHVVWEDDIQVFRKDNTPIPALQLQDYIDQDLLLRYQELFESDVKQWIKCEKQLPEVSDFIISNWQERLYAERLEQKSILIKQLLENSANDWESVLFKLLAKNFGLKVNGEAFLSLADSLSFSTVRKCCSNLNHLEALFYGQAGLLREETDNQYIKGLKNEYQFLKNKFRLNNQGVLPLQFFRLRPPNFPTIRLAQLAKLYHKNQQLFNDVIRINAVEDFYKILTIDTSEFWINHYTFEKESPSRKKSLTKSFIDLILINTIIPLKFFYAKTQGRDPEEEVFELISQLPREKNSVMDKYMTLNISVNNAMQSQAMIQLKNNYCDQKKCLKCAFGNYLLNRD